MKKILVTSYINPDLDGLASSYAYAEFLRKNGINAVAGVFGKPHMEAEFVLSKMNVKLMKGDKLINVCDNVVLVDVSSAHSISKKINPEEVVEIIDHRIQTTRDFPNAKIQIEPVGACATLIAEKFYNKKIVLSKESALLLYSAIVSNTINFKGSVTTERDKTLAEWLKQFFELPKNHIHEMFKCKSKVGVSLRQFLIQDFKVIYAGNKKIGIFQLEIIDSEGFIKIHLNEIIRFMAKIKKEKELDLIFLSCIDVEKEFNILVVVDNKSKNLLEKILKIEFKNGIGRTNKIVVRKEITPLIRKFLE